MAMLITKFHKLIGSKLIWSIFLVVIIVSFVFMFTEVPDVNLRRLTEAAPGMLDGEPVHPREFQHAESQFRLSLALRYGQWLPVSDELRPVLREEAWKRLAALRQAERMGLAISDQELANAIQQQQMFQREGRFDRALYEQFTGLYLARQLGVTRADFETHLREQLLMNRLEDMVQAVDLATPAELRQSARLFTDTFTIRYALVPMASVAGKEAVAQDQAQAYFETHAQNFTIPEQIKVDYVAFRYADYLDQVTVSDEEALAFYTATTNRFNRPAEPPAGEKSGEDAGPESPAPTPPTERIPFEDVREEIVAELRLNAARDLAGQTATEFVVDIQRASSRSLVPLRQVAQDQGLAFAETEAFSMEAAPTELKAPEFARAAFGLRNTAEEHFSDPVAGEEAVYVLGMGERIPSRIPEFAEVATQATAAAQSQLDADRLQDKVQELRTRFAEGLARGSLFQNLAEVEGLEVKTIENASALSGQSDDPNAGPLLRAAATLVSGELADPVPTDEGMLLAFVESRTQADPSIARMIEPRLRQNLLEGRFTQLFDGFQRYLLDQSGFKDMQPLAAPDGDTL